MAASTSASFADSIGALVPALASPLAKSSTREWKRSCITSDLPGRVKITRGGRAGDILDR